MREFPLISIIVPIYNGQEYIDGLFEQIYHQTYSNIEVIFVNDGSTDNSEKKIINSLNKYVSFKGYLINKPNEGQGAARNRGINESHGQYIAFMDQDDYIDNEYIEKLYCALSAENQDIVLSGYEHINNNGRVIRHIRIINGEWGKFMNITPWGKLYRKDFIIENEIRFFPIVLGEDVYFNINCYLNTNKIAYTEYVGYKWVANPMSVSNSIHRSLSNDVNILIVFNALLKIPTTHDWLKNAYYQYFLLKTGIYHILHVAKNTSFIELKEYHNNIFGWLLTNIPDLYNNRFISIQRKPQGETLYNATIIYTYVLFTRLRLINFFFKIYRFMLA